MTTGAEPLREGSTGRPGESRTPRAFAPEPFIARAASWASLAASFVLSASTWVAVALLAGFARWAAPFMPLVVDGYIVTALTLWLSPVSAKIAGTAKRHTYGAALVGVLVQSAYHAFIVWDATGSHWRTTVAAAVGALPPLFAALAVHMRALIRRETRKPEVAPAPLPPLPAPESLPATVPATAAELFAGNLPAAPVSPAPGGRRAAIERLRRDHPGITKGEVAARLGCSERTVYNAWRQPW